MVNKFLVGALLLLLIFPAYAIELPEELPVYKLTSADVRLEDKAGAFLETFFGDVRGGESRELDDRYVFEIDGKSLEVYKSSGGIWYEDKNRLWNFSITNVSLPDERRAKEIADAFLSSKSLLPLNRSIDRTESVLSIDYLGTGGTKIASFDLRNNTTEYVKQLDVQINYGLKVSDNNIDLPVVGGGRDICVVVGDQGDIIAYSGPRPGLEATLEGSYQVIPLEKANASYKDMIGDLKSVNYTVDLAYYLPPNVENQSYLIPVYEYRGIAMFDNETVPLEIILIPATKFPMEIYHGIKKLNMTSDPDKISRLGMPNTATAANQSTISGLSFSNPNSIYEFGTYHFNVDTGDANCNGFGNELAAIGWTWLMKWGAGNAWESDWNRNEDIFNKVDTGVDHADITFFHGHANWNGWALSPPDDGFLDRSEITRRYGDIDMEWIIIAACGPLQDNNIIPCPNNPINAFNWGHVFNGMHGILGRASVGYSNTDEGRLVAKYMKQGDTVVNSWLRAARDVQPSTLYNKDIQAFGHCPWSGPSTTNPQLWAAALVPYKGTISAENDHLWGFGYVSPDIPNPNKFWLIWTQT